jgi:acyl-CoA thioester hydrolase
VRYVECDPQGVVSNVHYFTYFDVAMTEFHRDAIWKYSQLIEAGAETVVADARARYHAPAAFDEELDVEVMLVQLGTTSLTVRFVVMRAEALLVEGELRYVFIDPATKTKRPVPQHVRPALGPYLPDADG